MFRSILLSLGAALTLSACQPPPPEVVPGDFEPAGELLVTVNGQKITQGMLDATLAQIPAQMREQLEQSGRIGQLSEQLVIGELLYRQALATNLHKDPAMQTALALSARNALADGMLDSVVEERITPERMKKWYDDHAVQFAKEQASIRVMVLETMDVANEVKGLLEGGADFAKLATERSKDPRTAPKGGDLGWMSKQDLRGEMGDAVFAADKGGVIGPFDSGAGGGVLFKVEDKRAAVPMSEVEDQIRESLQQEVIQEYIEELKAGATIVEAGKEGATVEVPAPAGADGAPPAPSAKAPPAPAAKAPPAPAGEAPAAKAPEGGEK